jgi:hypothetical protein
LLGLCASSAAASALVPTVGVYDETTTSRSVSVGGVPQTVINNVDFNAAFAGGTGGATAANITSASTGNGSSYSTTGPFNAAVANAFAANAGGVLNFDNVLSSSQFATVPASFGTSQGKSIQIGLGGTSTVSVGVTSETSISGLQYITPATASGYTLSFGSINNPDPGETGVIEAGFTLLSEDTGPSSPVNFGTVSAVATFSGGGTVTDSRTIDNLVTQGDTFYGFIAPAGQTISSITVSATNGANDLDDLAFITNAMVPEPAALSLLGPIALMLIRRRRER